MIIEFRYERFDVEKRRSVHHVYILYVESVPSYSCKSHHGKTYRIGTTRRSGSENSSGPVIEKRDDFQGVLS